MQRVLIIDNQMLVGAGIQSLLAGQADLDVVGISSGRWGELVRTIERFQPKVIVLDEANHRISLPKFLTLLIQFPRLRIVVVSANEDRIRLYDKQEVLVTGAVQLADIIRHS